MNYITFLQNDRDELRALVRQMREELLDITLYLQSRKFTGPDMDYVHVKTDILPKVEKVRFLSCGM